MPIKAGLVSYKHNNVAPFVGSRCNKFEHDLCPGPSKSVLSKFLTCYLNITFQSRCRHKQGVNKNTREKQLHSLADTDCWPIGAIISFFKNSSNWGKVRMHSVISRNFRKPPEKETYLNVPVPLKAQAGGGEQKHFIHWLMWILLWMRIKQRVSLWFIQKDEVIFDKYSTGYFSIKPKCQSWLFFWFQYIFWAKRKRKNLRCNILLLYKNEMKFEILKRWFRGLYFFDSTIFWC